MSCTQAPGRWYYPPLWLVVGSVLLLLGTLEYCYGYTNQQRLGQTYPGAPALFRALDDMDHREGAALAVTLLYLLE